jgi:hypothetical protein
MKEMIPPYPLMYMMDIPLLYSSPCFMIGVMDHQIASDLARAQRETESYEAAVEKRQEWSEKEARHRANLHSLIQLLINRAIEINECLPAKAVQQAMRLGIPVPSQVHPIKVTVGTPEPESASKSKSEEELRDEGLPTHNKTEFVRKLVLRRASGMTPAEIKKVARLLKMDVAANFPHTILFKLKANGAIREVEGKYFPVEND